MALVDVVVKVIYWMIVARIWRARIRSAGYNPDMFILQTDRPKDKIHPPQYIAAMKIFFAMYCAPEGARKALVHLAAEMQAGKTGVCDALIRIIRRNVEDGKMARNIYKNIFVVTGLSDKAWVRQTRKRLPDVNIHHNNTLAEMQTKLRALGEKGLRNVLIIVDESHVASAKTNRPEKCIYSELRTSLPDVATWASRNVHLLTVSATDPAIVLMIAEKERVVHGAVVGLETTKHYQSVQQLRESNRIRDVGNIGSDTVGELRRAVESYTTPRYHILRTESSADTVALLRREFPDARVMRWDAKNKKIPGDGASNASDDNDINDMLEVQPLVTTFVVIKRMFSCAKTMTDTYVGVLWDYVSESDNKDSVRLQSLLGRACGYGRSKDTVVYTSMRVVDDYLERWRDALRSVEGMRVLKDAVPSESNYTGTTVKDGKLKRAPRHAAPVAPRDDARSEYRTKWSGPFTLDQLLAFPDRASDKADFKKSADGFYSGKRYTEDDIKKRVESEKTERTGSRAEIAPGKDSGKTWIFYTDVNDASTARFMVRRIYRRNAEGKFPPGVFPDEDEVDPGARGPRAAGGVE